VAEIYRHKIGELHEVITVGSEQVYEALRCLIDRIVLSSAYGPLRIDLHGWQKARG
jgi:hypothetical protein